MTVVNSGESLTILSGESERAGGLSLGGALNLGGSLNVSTRRRWVVPAGVNERVDTGTRKTGVSLDLAGGLQLGGAAYLGDTNGEQVTFDAVAEKQVIDVSNTATITVDELAGAGGQPGQGGSGTNYRGGEGGVVTGVTIDTTGLDTLDLWVAVGGGRWGRFDGEVSATFKGGDGAGSTELALPDGTTLLGAGGGGGGAYTETDGDILLSYNAGQGARGDRTNGTPPPQGGGAGNIWGAKRGGPGEGYINDSHARVSGGRTLTGGGAWSAGGGSVTVRGVDVASGVGDTTATATGALAYQAQSSGTGAGSATAIKREERREVATGSADAFGAAASLREATRAAAGVGDSSSIAISTRDFVIDFHVNGTGETAATATASPERDGGAVAGVGEGVGATEPPLIGHLEAAAGTGSATGTATNAVRTLTRLAAGEGESGGAATSTRTRFKLAAGVGEGVGATGTPYVNAIDAVAGVGVGEGVGVAEKVISVPAIRRETVDMTYDDTDEFDITYDDTDEFDLGTDGV